MSSAEGRAGFLHRITKPAVWRGYLQVQEELEEDVKPMRRCKETRNEWAKHWQCDSEVQGAEDKPWSNEELRSLEEVLPTLNEENPERAARSGKFTTGVGGEGFHLVDLSEETTVVEVVKILDKLELCGRWPQQACTRMFFFQQTSRASVPSRFCLL